jgi:hypothetical protein
MFTQQEIISTAQVKYRLPNLIIILVFQLVKMDSFIVMRPWFIKRFIVMQTSEFLTGKLIMVLLHTPDPNAPNYTGGTDPLYKGYIGYVPTFDGDLLDYNGTFGFTNTLNGWKHDVSITFGGNQQLYTVEHTVNHSLKAASPTAFKPGGYGFSHIVGNYDISKISC